MTKQDNHASIETYDLLIIGAGPIGINCAIKAKEAGLHYVLIEKGVLVNSLFNFPKNMTFFSTSGLLEIGGVPFISHNDKPTRRESLEYFRRVVQSWDLDINYYEEVLSMDPVEDHYQVKTSKSSYRTHNVIIATGFFDTAVKMNIPGEDLPKVKHYYDEPHYYIKQKLVVVGSSNSACDVALETYYKAAEVTMIIREESIGRRVKYWIKPNIENRIKEGSIKAYFNSQILEIRPNEVLFQTPQGEMTIENDFVLAMTGYQPNYDFMEKIGLQFSDDEQRKPIHNEKTLETNLPNVYVAGVIISGMYTSKLFIENARIHANMIVGNILKQIV